MTEPSNPASLPLVQGKQAQLLEACGFACQPAGTREFNGVNVEMWRATGEKKKALAYLIGYGGAAFGAKTYGELILARVACELWPGVQVAMFRRTYPELDGPGAAMQKAYEIFTGAAQPTDGGREWGFPNGSTFFFRHCQNDADKYAYQSQQIDILLIDEATHFTWSIVDYLLTRNRGGTRGLRGFQPFAVLTANPGNIGHVWYSQSFDVIQQLGPHMTVKNTKNLNGKQDTVYFIPAFIADNQIGVAQDPEYEARLRKREPQIAKALCDGDWTIFAGQAFAEWTRDRISCKPIDIPDSWPRWRAVDYGLDHPFCSLWFTKDIDKDKIYVYRAVKKDGLTDTQQARLIQQMTPPDEKIITTYASPDMWARKTVKNKIFTSVDEYKDEGVILSKADNDRLSGKRKVDRLLVEQIDGKPALQVFEEYYGVLDSMPTLVKAKDMREDVEKIDGDDDYDTLRYGLTNTKPKGMDSGPGTKSNPMNKVNGVT